MDKPPDGPLQVLPAKMSATSVNSGSQTEALARETASSRRYSGQSALVVRRLPYSCSRLNAGHSRAALTVLPVLTMATGKRRS